ncbi:MAG: hypothetical protein K8S18_01080 [Desulfobacula sp.]|nr:hypothetical protein [Desulfobacula sp.]
MDLTIIKNLIDIIESIVTIIAILAGGIWSYRLFIKKRLKYPRANISNQVFHRCLSEDKVLLHVVTTISNTGDVLISIISGITWIQQMTPLHTNVIDSIKIGINPVLQGKTEIDWPLLEEQKFEWKKGKFEIEPGENDQIHYDFILDSYVETVKIYSFYKNVMKHGRELGWSVTTIYDLQNQET